MVLDDASVFLATIDKMERYRLDILQRWKVVVMTLDNYYHSQHYVNVYRQLHVKLLSTLKDGSLQCRELFKQDRER